LEGATGEWLVPRLLAFGAVPCGRRTVFSQDFLPILLSLAILFQLSFGSCAFARLLMKKEKMKLAIVS